MGAAAHSEVVVHGFRDGFFPYIGAEVKDEFEQLKSRLDPDVILTHARQDLHQDHRLVCELTWNTWRDHLILEYEIPKYDGDLGSPNVFVPLGEDLVRRKAELLVEHFPSQAGKHWFSEELFLGLLRIRGMEASASTRYAEAFTCRKLLLR
jgi:LmbE family N-acetylglucosaminyl deacetylase